MSNRYFAGMALLVVGYGLVSGCASDEDCDSGQILRGAYCYAVPVDASPTPDSGGSTDSGLVDGGACTLGDGGVDPIGSVCTDGVNHSDCDCLAPYCAISPGMTEGSCTRTDCVEFPDRCPAGYTCMDLSVFNPSLPSICVLE